jgi:hypothetical protein
LVSRAAELGRLPGAQTVVGQRRLSMARLLRQARQTEAAEVATCLLNLRKGEAWSVVPQCDVHVRRRCGQVRQPETVEVANFLLDRMGCGAVSAELLQPDELVAAIIAQAGARAKEAWSSIPNNLYISIPYPQTGSIASQLLDARDRLPCVMSAQ